MAALPKILLPRVTLLPFNVFTETLPKTVTAFAFVVTAPVFAALAILRLSVDPKRNESVETAPSVMSAAAPAAPDVIVTGAIELVAAPRTIAFASRILKPAVLFAPPIKTTLPKSLANVVSASRMSPAAVSVVRDVEVIAADCLIEPPVEVTTSVGTVMVLALLPAPRLISPPAVILKFPVADFVRVPLFVTEAESEGAERLTVAVPAEIAPVDRLPVEAVRVKLAFPIKTSPTVTEPPEIDTALPPALILPVEIEPFAAVSVKVCELIVVVVMLPAVAVAVRLLPALIAPRLRLPVLEVTVMLVF